MTELTELYLAKQGVLIAISSETGFLEAQKIDVPEEYAWEMDLDFIPPTLESDEIALDIVHNISDITLDDDTLTEEEREIIIEDCFDLIVSF